MSKKIPLVVSGIIFTLVALIHALRLIYHWHITVSGHSIPMSVSIIGFIVTGILAIWMLVAAAKKS